MKKRQGIYLKEEAGFIPKIEKEAQKKKKNSGENKNGKGKKKKS